MLQTHELQNRWLVHKDKSSQVEVLQGFILGGCRSTRCAVTVRYNGLVLCNVQLCGIQDTLVDEGLTLGELHHLLQRVRPDLLVVIGASSSPLEDVPASRLRRGPDRSVDPLGSGREGHAGRSVPQTPGHLPPAAERGAVPSAVR